MDLADGARVLVRRWIIVVLGVALTLGAAALVYTRAPQSYQTNARLLLLLPPGAQGGELPNSPFLYLPNGLNILASHVAVATSTQQFRQDMVHDGFDERYEVGVSPGDPIITVSVTGSHPAGVIATRDAIIDRLRTELDRVQDEEKVPDRQRAHFRTAGLNAEAQAMGGNKLQGAVGTAALGGLLTLLVAFLVDRRRRAGAQRPSAQRAEPPAGDAPA